MAANNAPRPRRRFPTFAHEFSNAIVLLLLLLQSLKRSFMARFLQDDDETDDDPLRPKRSFLWRRGDGDQERRSRRKGVMERVFGICKSDPKHVREASSIIHPQSPFATCPPRLCAPPHSKSVFGRLLPALLAYTALSAGAHHA